MRHTYQCQLRWADLDPLRHVNNVLYIDYLQEARIDMLAALGQFHRTAETNEGLIVVEHRVEFAAPLTFRLTPVSIDVWVEEIKAASFTLGYEIYDETDSGRTTYLHAFTVLTPFRFDTERPRRLTEADRQALTPYLHPVGLLEPLTTRGSSRHVAPVKVRWSDLDPYRHVNNVKYFEYFQEARIPYLYGLGQAGGSTHNPDQGWVLARSDVKYRRPIHYRREPYQLHQWISHVGTSSFVIAAQICDADNVLASGAVIMVGFDVKAQSVVALSPAQREVLLRELPDEA